MSSILKYKTNYTDSEKEVYERCSYTVTHYQEGDWNEGSVRVGLCYRHICDGKCHSIIVDDRRQYSARGICSVWILQGHVQ